MSNRKNKRKKYLNELNGICNPVLIKTWDELKECTSKTHYLEIEEFSGWAYPKNKKNMEHSMYLSTHTFYGGTHQYSTQELQRRGFNVVIDNWDKNN